MIGHLRIPRFYARTLQKNHEEDKNPLVVVDEGRIVEFSPEADTVDVNAGDLLDGIEFPDELTVESFDLQAFVEGQNEFYSAVQRTFPIIENFRFGELMVEVTDPDDFEDWITSTPLNRDLSVTGAVAESGWLARILSCRRQPGGYKILSEGSYQKALQSVEAEEIWGLGREFTQTLRHSELETAGEVFYLTEAEQRELFGTTSRALQRIFEGGDPKPLNPFSRPRSISQKLTVEDDDLATDRLGRKLERIISRFKDQLERAKSLTYQLELILHAENQNQCETRYTFTSPTDRTDTLRVGVNSMLSGLDVPGRLEAAELRANTLVANTSTYHRETQEDLENLEVLS